MKIMLIVEVCKTKKNPIDSINYVYSRISKCVSIQLYLFLYHLAASREKKNKGKPYLFPFICPVYCCKLDFPSHQAMVAHLNKKHKSYPHFFRCSAPACTKRFTSKAGLDDHICNAHGDTETLPNSSRKRSLDSEVEESTRRRSARTAKKAKGIFNFFRRF